mgnify:CR=1 FL=1
MFDLTSLRRQAGKDMFGLKSEIDDLFNRFLDVDFPLSRESIKTGEWSPRLDISEGEKDISISAEIPGCDAKDIEVTLEGRILTIKGEKKQEKEEKTKNYLRAELFHGYFSRSLVLPTDVDQKEVEALYKKGVLKVVLKKSRLEEGNKIEIKTN